MNDRKDVEFLSADGLKLRGWLYSAGAKKPCIVMSPGYSAQRGHFLQNFAKRFQAAGYAVLLYDNRHWGDSEGEPRNHADPILQTRDYSAAYDFVASLADVDPAKVVFWGTSMSGGNVICAAAVDRRVAAVIAQGPYSSGEAVALKMGNKVNKLRAAQAAAEKPIMIPVLPQSSSEVYDGTSHAIIASTDALKYMKELERCGEPYETMMTAQSLFDTLGHEPMAYIHRLAPIPFLMTVGDADTVCPTESQLEMYQKAREPKTIHMTRGQDHFSVYYGPHFEEAIQVQLEFLQKNL